ncbi:tripartite tricarboxylate transporter TctB family protein [Alkalihalophilus marmarensis]|uniref:tripartite tricarboxylate transporter TctB family protein n=1 Tax=Alkalihalophilus marmarensis TaxID=521377 RepID=UPI002DBE166A|nr:tripartite tricarboxylate transporter TctB family protein [Alkalihalophilus marmarensis]MEC2074131.1 tripartite tricarboxylate transporter TctB family protein [Alkalihalophilus marmarensis]
MQVARRLDVMTSIIIILLMSVFFFVAKDLRAPAHIFPLTVISLLLAFGVLLLIKSLFFYKEPAKEEEEIDNRPETEKKAGKKRVYFSIVIMFGYIFLLNVFGFYVTSFIYLALFSWYLGGAKKEAKPLLQAGLVSSITMMVIYLAFKVFLRVPTPTGFFF